jgi:hypothetical protein
MTKPIICNTKFQEPFVLPVNRDFSPRLFCDVGKSCVMFNAISWQTYWLTMMPLLALYYLLVYWILFRKRFSHLLLKNVGRTSIAGSSTIPQMGEEVIVNACLDEINAFFEEQKKCKAEKDEVLYGIQHIFLKYPSLKGSSYRQAMQKVIATQCANSCLIQISSDDIGKVWMD